MPEIKRTSIHISAKTYDQIEALARKWADQDRVHGLIDLDNRVIISTFIKYVIDKTYQREFEDKTQAATITKRPQIR